MQANHQGVKSYSPLQIPARQRKPGEAIWCGKCNTNVTDKCKATGKRKSTCKHGEHHRFQSRVYDKKLRKMVRVKTYPKDLRDYNEFTRLHPIELDKYFSRGIVKIQTKRPTLLRDALKKYYDWLNDIDVPSHQKKGLDAKHVKNQLNNLVTFRESMPGYESLSVIDVTDEHVGIFHDFLERKDYAAKTYNNKMETLRSAFDYFIKELKYPLEGNPFSRVVRKKTQSKKDFVHIDDFWKLLEITTLENGIKFERCSDRVKRVSLHRDWLTDYWELALWTGGRRKDIAFLTLDMVKEHHIEKYDHKVSKKKRTDVIHWLPRSHEFNQLLQRLTKKYGLTGSDYLIEPTDPNRTTISNHASKAFTHYWRFLDPGYYARMYSLRDTHITLMIQRYGNLYEGVFGSHENIKTSLDNYASFEQLIRPFSGKSMLG